MEKIKVLWLEDKKSEFTKYVEWFDEALLGGTTKLKFDFHWEGTLQGAKAWMKENHEKCDLCLVDLQLNDDQPNSLDGERFITHVIRENYKVGIIVVSAMQVSKALKLGAHGFFEKETLDFNRLTDAEIIGEFRKALNAVGKSLNPAKQIDLKYDLDDLNLSSVVNQVGDDVIKNLLAQISNREINSVALQYVRPGLSGSVVLRADVKYAPSTDFERDERKLLLKFDRDLGRISAEFASFKKLERLSSALRVQYLEGVPPKNLLCDGWYMTAQDFTSSSKDFSSWLGEISEKNVIEEFLRVLFLSDDGLASVYQSTARVSHASILSRIRQGLSTKRRALLASSIKEIAACAQRCGVQIDFQRLRDFSQDGRLEGVSENRVLGEALECWNHGDLHGRNILVALDRKSPVLIDPAEIDWGFVGQDLARLTVDLMLEAVSCGIEQHFWDLVNARSEIAFNLLNSVAMSHPSRIENCRASVIFSLDWISENRVRILDSKVGKVPEWQFKCLLLVEVLRYVAFPTVSMVNKVICSRIAHLLIDAVLRDLPSDSLRD